MPAGGQPSRRARAASRLRTDYLDVYLLHWRGDTPLAQTVAAFEELRADGRIRAWGVSNFDTADVEELLAVPGGEHCVVNQVLYHLASRGIEHDLLPLCRSRSIAVMAYSPVGQGRLLRHKGLNALAAGLGSTAAQVALAWLLAQDGVAAIPKATDPAHVREVRAASDLRLSPTVLRELDRMFPPPPDAPVGHAVVADLAVARHAAAATSPATRCGALPVGTAMRGAWSGKSMTW
jgi:diketogulonate reductase-like aldo/keto reductase